MSTLYEQVTKICDTLAGETIVGKYELQKVLGRGGMSAVFSGIQHPMGRKVAVKVIPTNAETAAQRFKREATVVSRLAHPNIVTVFDFGDVDGDYLYLAMEHLEGETLGELIRGIDGPMPYERAVKIAIQSAKALGQAHQAGVVHRDVKPDNIFLTEIDGVSDVVKVLDFGIAKAFEDNHDISLTMEGHVVGTPIYISPEQIRDEGIDQRADIYALGCILYEMLTGKPPFSGHINKLFMAHLQQTAPSFADRIDDARAAAEIPVALEDLVFRMMRKQADERPHDTTELITQLQVVLAAEAPPPMADEAKSETVEATPRVATGFDPLDHQVPLAESLVEASTSSSSGEMRSLSEALDDPDFEVELDDEATSTAETRRDIKPLVLDESGETAPPEEDEGEARSRAMLKIALLAVPLLVAAAVVAALAIDGQLGPATTKPEVKTQPAPASITFTVDARGVQYYYLARKGNAITSAARLTKIPLAERAAVHVVTPELGRDNVRLPRDKAYITNLIHASAGEVIEAPLVPEAQAEPQRRSAYLGADAADELKVRARLIAATQGSDDDAP